MENKPSPAPLHRLVGRSFNSLWLLVVLLSSYLTIGFWHILHGNNIDHLPMLFCLGSFVVCVHAYLPPNSKFASEYNAKALEHLEAALAALHQRTKDREAKAVEGTHGK